MVNLRMFNMRAVLTIVGLLFAESVYALSPNINSNQAKLYIDQNANVCGKVVRIGSDHKSNDRFLNIDSFYPNEIFYFYVPSTTNINLNKYLNKNICGFGKVKHSPRSDIKNNRVVPQIIITNESQISFQ